MKLKNALFYLLLILSAGITCLLLSAPSVSSAMIFFALWLFLCFALSRADLLQRFSGSLLLAKGIGFLFSLSFAYTYRNRFCELTARFLPFVPLDSYLLLRRFIQLIAAGSFFFVTVSAACLLDRFFRILMQLNWKELLQTLPRMIHLRSAVLGLANILCAILLGTVLLTTVQLLPIRNIQKNVQRSAVVFQTEGTYHSLFSWCQSQLDNFTDALILLTSSDDAPDTALNRAMYSYNGWIDDLSPAERLVAHYVDGIDFTEHGSYARYWHGYQVLLRPLLEIFDYQQIRILNGLVQLLLCLAVCWLMYRKKKAAYAVPYFIGYLMMMPLALADSLQFSSCYYVYTIGCLVLLCCNDVQRKKCAGFLFLNLGLAIAYFDFLTYPIATCGVPLLVYLMLTQSASFEEQIRQIIRCVFCWGIGYAGMWSSKWVLATWITGTNVLQSAQNAAAFRTSHGYAGAHYTMISCITQNIRIFIRTPFFLLFLGFLVYVLLKSASYKSRSSRTPLYGFVALLPLVWYTALMNHSSIHSWFTNKACLVLLLAVGFTFAENLEAPPKKL